MGLIAIVLLLAAILLAYANGANDNIKGVATLLGSRTCDYRRALGWATLTTLAGSLAALLMGRALAQAFSGSGLLPDAVVADPAFLAAVGLGAAITVLIATRLGLPVSTTHSLVGALVGAGLVAVGDGLRLSALGDKFIFPLLASPFVALALTAPLYLALRRLRLALGVEAETCVCIGTELIPIATQATTATALPVISVAVDRGAVCVQRYQGRLLGIDAQQLLDAQHYLSAGAVSFARGLNDTPKILGLLLGAGALGISGNLALALVALAIALGGLFGARRVARTMAAGITPMNTGQGCTANLVTAFLVIFASGWGLPVSTTHVSCGALFGIGLARGDARWKTIAGIFLAWITTLPLGMASAAVAYGALTWSM